MARTSYHQHIIRIIPALDRQLRRVAKRDGATVTDVWRQALSEYLDRRENGHG